MKKRFLIFGLTCGLVVLFVATAAGAQAGAQHIRAYLYPVGGSGVTGSVNLVGLPHGGTQIDVVARGLRPGNQYVSLYYSNHTCALEPYSASDVIGGRYSANRCGIGTTAGRANDNLDEINSVSVRRAGDFSLIACANVHP